MKPDKRLEEILRKFWLGMATLDHDSYTEYPKPASKASKELLAWKNLAVADELEMILHEANVIAMIDTDMVGTELDVLRARIVERVEELKEHE